MTTKLKTLYSRTSTGNIQQWSIFFDGDKFWTEEGIVGGKLSTTTPTVCHGKNAGRANATTPQEQAKKEAEARWKKKLKQHYFEDIKDIDKVQFIEPMLAEKFYDYIDSISYPVMVDRKYNGMRCVINKDGMFTRTGESIISAPHIFKAIKQLYETYPDLVLDGELYNHKYRHHLNELISIVRKTKNVSQADLDKSAAIVKYYVYDGYGFDNITTDTICSKRRAGLVKLLKDIPDIVVVDYKMAKNQTEVENIYNSYVVDGYEGAIVRIDTKYYNKRTKNLLKMKPTDDAEFTIIDIKEGTGDWTGSGKTVTVKGDVIDSNGNVITPNVVFDCNFKGTYEDAVQFLKEKSNWIGKSVTIYYNGLTGKGTPNYGQFDYNNSIKGDRK